MRRLYAFIFRPQELPLSPFTSGMLGAPGSGPPRLVIYSVPYEAIFSSASAFAATQLTSYPQFPNSFLYGTTVYQPSAVSAVACFDRSAHSKTLQRTYDVGGFKTSRSRARCTSIWRNAERAAAPPRAPASLSLCGPVRCLIDRN